MIQYYAISIYLIKFLQD